MAPVLLLLLQFSAPPEGAARRLALLQAKPDVATLARAVADPDPLVARTAARLLVASGPAAAPQLAAVWQSKDALLRANAALGLSAWGEVAVEPLAKALADPEWLVRRSAVFALAQIRPLTDRLMALQAQAAEDESQEVRDAASQAARQNYQTLATIPLPTDDWRFRKDPKDEGRGAKWYAAGFDDTGWETIGIGAAWQTFGHDYTGPAWYRRTVDLPAKDPKSAGAYLSFGGVDEQAWVWVNGQAAGEHAIGPSGWDKPFSLDVSALLRWGEANQITVRAANTAAAGGIWRPVAIRILGRPE